MLTPRNGRRRRRPDESGQILIAVLALIAYVGIMAVAAFTFLDGAFLQHKRTETTAANNAVVQGAARYAVEAVANSQATQCGGPAKSSTDYSPSSGVSDHSEYTVANCIANYDNQHPGGHCALCILSSSDGALNLNNNAAVTVSGEVDINGTIATDNKSTLCATSAPNCGGSPEFIGIAGTLPSDTSPYTPAPVHIAAISDPLAAVPYPQLGQLSVPPVTANNKLSPGTYTGIKMSGGTLTLDPGVYVFTGDVSLSGNAILSGTDVTLFFTCSPVSNKVPVVSTACTSGNNKGAALDLSGGGHFMLSAPTAATPNNPYVDLLVFYDRNNIGDLTGGSGMRIAGNGTDDALSGGAYAAASGVDIGGEGNSIFTTNGRLVVAAANIHVGASVGGLNLVGVQLTTTCDLYNATVKGSETTGGAAPKSYTGQVTFVSDPFVSDPNQKCGGTRIVSFTYTP